MYSNKITGIQNLTNKDLVYSVTYDGIDGSSCPKACPLNDATMEELMTLELRDDLPKDDPDYCLQLAAWWAQKAADLPLVPIRLMDSIRPGKFTTNARRRICIARRLAAQGITLHWPVADDRRSGVNHSPKGE